MKNLKGKMALITGASAGIGEACAEQLAELGMNLILIARRIDKVNDLASILRDKHKVDVLAVKLDIQDKKAVKNIINGLDGHWKNIDLLVNNAGVGVSDALMQDANVDDWDTIIDTNIKGMLYVIKSVLPVMIERNYGQIINIGSTTGHTNHVKANVYSASKHAVKILSRGLRTDLKGYKIKVCEIAPGAVKTEFNEQRWDKVRADKYYEGFTALETSDIADAVVYCATRPQHVNISELVVYPVDHYPDGTIHRSKENQSI